MNNLLSFGCIEKGFAGFLIFSNWSILFLRISIFVVNFVFTEVKSAICCVHLNFLNAVFVIGKLSLLGDNEGVVWGLKGVLFGFVFDFLILENWVPIVDYFDGLNGRELTNENHMSTRDSVSFIGWIFSCYFFTIFGFKSWTEIVFLKN